MSSMLCAVARDRTGGFVVTKAPSPLRKNSMTLSSDCVDCSNATVLICASVESVAGSSGTVDGTGVRTSAEERVEGGGGDSVPVCVPVNSSDSKILCPGIDTPPPPPLRIVGSQERCLLWASRLLLVGVGRLAVPPLLCRQCPEWGGW